MADGNERQQEQAQPIAQSDNQDDVFVEPTDISEAFETLREIKQMSAEAPVEQQQGEPPAAEQPAAEQQQSYYEGDYQPPAWDPEPTSAVQEGAGGESNGAADSMQGFDYSLFARGMMEDITVQAARDATQSFKDQGIQKFDVNMLYNRDENTGMVTFRNPDNPNMPFSSRKEAQDWCDSINNDIDKEWRKEALKRRKELVEERMPAMRLMEFAPVFYSMTPREQRNFDELIEDHAIYDNEQNIIGYKCDLYSMADRAKRMAARQEAELSEALKSTQKVAAPASGPAVDMRSSSSAAQEKKGIDEPKNIQEAMSILKNFKE